MKDNITILTLLELEQLKPHVAKLVYEKKIYERDFADIHEFIVFIQKEIGLNLGCPLVTAAYNRALEIKNKSTALGVDILTPGNPCFPLALAHIAKPPVLLYAKGNNALLHALQAVTVIGAREASSNGLKFAHDIACALVSQGYVVVSGLAVGCDTAAHTGTLNAKGKTIALLAHGLDSVYPRENTKLAEDILAQGGCLLSEYPPGIRPEKLHFIERDRLQSGLSKGVIVIQSAVKGGTMHTAKFAKQQHKPLACVCPKALKDGSLSIDVSGNELLLAEGAQLIRSPEQLSLFIDFIQKKNTARPQLLGLVQAPEAKKTKRQAPNPLVVKESLKQTKLDFFGKSLAKKPKQSEDNTKAKTLSAQLRSQGLG